MIEQYTGLNSLNGISLVMLSAEGCPFCNRTLKALNKLYSQAPYINYYILDVIKSKNLLTTFKKYFDGGVPMLFLFDDKKILRYTSGEKSLSELKEFILLQ